MGSEMLLQPADPEHQLGNDHGLRIGVEADELSGIDRASVRAVPVPELIEGFQDLGLKPLQAVKADIEEIACSAGGIEHANLAEVGLESSRQTESLGVRADRARLFDPRTYAFPVRPERLHDRLLHDGLNVATRRVVGSEPTAFRGAQGMFQKGAEDRRLDIAPFPPRRLEQQFQLARLKRQGFAVPEKSAVDVGQFAAERPEIPAAPFGLIEAVPELCHHGRELTGRLDTVLDQANESGLWK